MPGEEAGRGYGVTQLELNKQGLWVHGEGGFLPGRRPGLRREWDWGQGGPFIRGSIAVSQGDRVPAAPSALGEGLTRMYSAPSELFSYSLMVENTDSTRQEKTSRNLRIEGGSVSQSA